MSLSVDLTTSPPEGYTELILNTVWGTEKGTRYRQTAVRERLKDLPDPKFLNLRKGSRLLATVNFSRRNYAIPGPEIDSYYIRYLSFLSGFQTGRDDPKPRKHKSKLRIAIEDSLSQGICGDHPSLYYAYVEIENKRSERFCNSFKFQPVRKISTITFSRLRPTDDPDVVHPGNEDIEEIKELLTKTYKDFSFYPGSDIDPERYYILRNSDQIVAGLQINEVRWKIEELAGAGGKVLMGLLPRIPVFSRIFDPENFRFLTAEQVYVREGNEKYLQQLMTAVLSRKGYNSMLTWADWDCTLHRSFRRIDKGILNKFASDVPSQMIVRAENMHNDQAEKLRSQPTYVNPIDIT